MDKLALKKPETTESTETGSPEDAYLNYLFDAKDDDPKVAHIFEGINPEKAKLLKDIVARYKKAEEAKKVDQLRDKIISSQEAVISPPDNVAEASSLSEEESPKIAKQRTKLGSFLKKAALVAMFTGLLGSGKNNKNIGEKSIFKKAKHLPESIEKLTFDQSLTPEELEIRKNTIRKYLEDSVDIKRHPTEDSILDRDFDEIVEHYKIFLQDCKKQLDSISTAPSHSSSHPNADKNYIELLKRNISRTEELIKEAPERKMRLKKANLEYLRTRDSIKIEEIVNIYREYDNQKKWMQDVIQSKQYLERLTIEYGGDGPRARAEQERRLQSLQKDYLVEDRETISEAVKGASAYYDYNKSHLPNRIYDSTTAVHEYQHQTTEGNIEMSEYAKDLYKKAFDSSKVTKRIIVAGRTEEEYFGTATEMDARKKELESRMEKIGIKKYGEKFTDKHLKLLLNMQKKGELRDDFLRIIKPAYIKKIMNTIAVNENKDKNKEDLS